MPEIKKKPRKISCLPCRNKKARCDGEKPHCNRCIRNSREHLCIYPKPKTYGRPPKNALFHKNQDLPIASPTERASPEQISRKDGIQCREFIFENQSNQQQASSSQQNQLFKRGTFQVSQRFIKYNDRILDIEKIFELYISRNQYLRQTIKDYQLTPRFKLKTLNQHFTWLTSSLVNVTIKRACQLITLESFFDPEFVITAFIREEQIKSFFFCNSSNHHGSSPLNSMPTDQAIQLIDYFFQLHPYHILLNKTKLLQDYWSDSVEPLLLCVIYGISIYTGQQTAKGGAYKLWDTQRNPFLNYAYVLMEKFFLQRDMKASPSTLGNYQAVVILGIFEALFGLPKHGMTIISLSYMMAVDLGIFRSNMLITDGVINDSRQRKDKPKSVNDYDPIDKELLINTYWAALRSTAYGCIEMGLYLRDNLLYHGQPFPPANCKTSASYQYDLLHNNHTSSSSYLIETFHVEMVVTYFSSKLFSCLPKTEYNIFGCKTYPPPPPSDEQQRGHDMLLQLLNTAAASAACFNSEIESKVQLALNDFSDFIAQERYQWSYHQSFTIEAIYYLYCIHFSFIKPSNNVMPIRYQHIISNLNLTDPRVATRVSNLVPTTLALLTLLQNFLEEAYSRPMDHGLNSDESSIDLLPFGIMSAALETLVELTIAHYHLGLHVNKIYDQIVTVCAVAKHPLFWVPQQQAASKVINRKLKDFLRLNQIPVVHAYDGMANTNNPATTVAQPPPPSAFACNQQSTSSSFGAGNHHLSFLFLDESQMFASDSNSSISSGSHSVNNNSVDLFQDFDSLFQNVFDGIY